MFSLVEYTNNEKSIVATKQIKVIQGTTVIVKAKGGAKYEAQLLQKSDSKDELNIFFSKSVTNEINSPLISRDKLLQTKIVDNDILSSTRINLNNEPELFLEISQIASTEDLKTPESSVPSGYSEIFDKIGYDWMEDSNKSTEPPLLSRDSNLNFSESHYLVNKICSSKNKQVLTDNDDDSDNFNRSSPKFHYSAAVNSSTEVTTVVAKPSTQDSSQDPDHNILKSTNIETMSSVNISKSVVSLEKSSLLDDSPAVDVRELEVPVSKKLSKRTVKKHFCLFCHTLQCKFARHLTLKHKDQEEVKKLLNLPKQNTERKLIIDKLRKKGDFLHNVKPEYNTGILISSRQRQAKYNNTAEDYICCQRCKGFFSKKTIRFHSYKCNSTCKKGTRNSTITGRRVTGYMHKKADLILRRVVFPILNDDDVSRSIKYDELVILYGNKLCQKYTLDHQHDMIRAQLRLLGRFKLAIKSINSEIGDFESIFKPQHFDSSIIALRTVAHWDTDLMWFKTPAVAQNLSTLIKKVANKYRTECIKNQDEIGKKNVCDFLLLWEEEIPVLINKKAAEDQTLQKRQKKVILPSKSDIKLLFDYLNDQANIAYGLLKDEFNHAAWVLLNSSTLILIQIFNRRRAGELERLKIIDFQNRLELDENVNPDLYTNLSAETVAYAKQYVRLTLRGKLGREVSLLLTPSNVEFIGILLKYRQNAGVKTTNEYVFAVPGAHPLRKQYIRACPLMRKFANECGALIPSSLRGTSLRKHIATFTAMLEVEGHQVERLANFMGHHKEIHRGIYRVPVPVAEMTDVSRLLVAAMGGDEDEENVESEEENSDSSDEENEYFENNESNETTSYNNLSNYSTSLSTESLTLTDKLSHQKKKTKEIHQNTLGEIKRRSTSPYGKTKRTKWSDSEKRAVIKHFGDLLKIKKLPSLHQCQVAIRKYEVLRKRQPQQLKSFIDNQRKMKSRRETYALNKAK